MWQCSASFCPPVTRSTDICWRLLPAERRLLALNMSFVLTPTDEDSHSATIVVLCFAIARACVCMPNFCFGRDEVCVPNSVCTMQCRACHAVYACYTL